MCPASEKSLTPPPHPEGDLTARFRQAAMLLPQRRRLKALGIRIQKLTQTKSESSETLLALAKESLRVRRRLMYRLGELHVFHFGVSLLDGEAGIVTRVVATSHPALAEDWLNDFFDTACSQKQFDRLFLVFSERLDMASFRHLRRLMDSDDYWFPKALSEKLNQSERALANKLRFVEYLKQFPLKTLFKQPLVITMFRQENPEIDTKTCQEALLSLKRLGYVRGYMRKTSWWIFFEHPLVDIATSSGEAPGPG